MYKFFVLVRKEIKELLTLQTILPLVAVVLVFIFIGNVAGKQTKNTQAPQNVAVLDLDSSTQSAQIIALLGKVNLNVNKLSDQTIDAALATAQSEQDKALLVIPQGFGSSLGTKQPEKIEDYSIMQSFSVMGAKVYGQIDAALATANAQLSNAMLKTSGVDNPNLVKNPLQINNHVMVGSRQAEVSYAAVSGFVSSQTTFIPIVLFLIITFSTQLIAASMANEKENKTLETLLSSPVSRKAIVAAKLVGASLVALLTAVIYLYGLQKYIGGLSGGGGVDVATQNAVQSLGLVFTLQDYLLLGLVLFLAILVALSIAIILGSFAEDIKSVQGLTMPLMVLVLIPYLLTLLFDINSLSGGMRIFVYAIPFTHAFLAAPNILLHHYQPVWYGLLYLAVLFLVFVVIASRIFSSDKILTMKLRLRRK